MEAGGLGWDGDKESAICIVDVYRSLDLQTIKNGWICSPVNLGLTVDISEDLLRPTAVLFFIFLTLVPSFTAEYWLALSKASGDKPQCL